jgi:hypothetical protein
MTIVAADSWAGPSTGPLPWVGGACCTGPPFPWREADDEPARPSGGPG